jgi:hypothetical protein
MTTTADREIDVMTVWHRTSQSALTFRIKKCVMEILSKIGFLAKDGWFFGVP